MVILPLLYNDDLLHHWIASEFCKTDEKATQNTTATFSPKFPQEALTKRFSWSVFGDMLTCLCQEISAFFMRVCQYNIKESLLILCWHATHGYEFTAYFSESPRSCYCVVRETLKIQIRTNRTMNAVRKKVAFWTARLCITQAWDILLVLRYL